MFGITHFAAVINPPQSCILAVGGLQNRMIPEADKSLVYTLLY
jgi:pyruvate dehydrogenase E2 component (dihydrolipoamide acetyltransferase)